MWATVAIALTVIVVIGIALTFWARSKARSKAFNQASDIAKQVFPVWAAQGPFDSGTESAAALRSAYLAVLGAEQTEEMADGFEGHEIAYDADPESWEEIRRTTLDGASSDALTLAEGIVAAKGVNKALFEDIGRRWEFTRQPNGSVGLLSKKIWSDEEIKKKKDESDEALYSGIGQGLLDDSESSEEARELVEFLGDLYRAEVNEEPDASALGRVWLACFTMSLEKAEAEAEPEPEFDPEILQTFKRLNKAHKATMPSDLEWSQNPGCFEGHLKRKHDNPLFPEPDREVTQEQIDEARERDQEDAAKLREELLELDLQLPEIATVGDLVLIRERIGDLLDKAAGIGGDADAISDSLITIHKTLIDSMRESLKDNEEGLRALEKADEYTRSLHDITHTPTIAQYRRIPSDDLISAILSESPDTIRKVMSLIGYNTLIVKGASDLMESALAEGADIPLADEKLRAIRGEGD